MFRESHNLPSLHHCRSWSAHRSSCELGQLLCQLSSHGLQLFTQLLGLTPTPFTLMDYEVRRQRVSDKCIKMRVLKEIYEFSE